MNEMSSFKLSGVAIPGNAADMLDEICEHFIEHADVERIGDLALLKSNVGLAHIQIDAGRLLIDLDCPTAEALQMSRTILAEHLFYFAEGQPFELTWSEPTSLSALPNLHEVTVVSAEDVTPHMRRVIFSCADVTPFIGGDMHVRLLVPSKGKAPVWPGFREDGRIAWPEGEDELLVRVYTIRAVDAERGELWIDFLQHPAPDVATPGADGSHTVRLRAKRFVQAVSFETPGHVPEDNYFHLAPGDERTVVLRPRPSARAFRGFVHALNATAPVRIELAPAEAASPREGPHP